MEIVGPQMGRLDQETAKLALLAKPADQKPASSAADRPAEITIKLIEDAVGGWRAKTAWEMIDAAAAGDAQEAIAQLDRLILAGESPVALMGQIAWRFRQLAAGARVAVQAVSPGGRVNLRQALEQVGVKTWQGAMDKAEGNLRQLGARRAAKLYRWLVEADVALKGSSSSGDRARLVIEQLFVRMSKQLAPRPTAAQQSALR
jgi:DNA polymerase-3 subunit delta